MMSSTSVARGASSSGHVHRLALGLGGDDRPQARGVGVLEGLGLEGTLELLDQLEGQLHLIPGDIGLLRKIELAGVPERRGETEQGQQNDLALGLEHDQMLAVPEDERPDGHLLRLGHGLAEQGVGLMGLFLRLEIVGLLQVFGVDVLFVDEDLDLDGRAPFDVGLLEIRVAQDDEIPVPVFVPLDDVLEGDLLAGQTADLLVRDRAEVVLAQVVHRVDLGLDRGVEIDRHVDQAEADHARPGRARPGRVFSSSDEWADLAAFVFVAMGVSLRSQRTILKLKSDVPSAS